MFTPRNSRSDGGARSRRRLVAATTAVGLVATPLALGLVAPASAAVATTITDFPHTETWSVASAITANDNWSGVLGTEGYLGQDITTSSAGVDPQTLTGVSALANDTDVIANQTNPNTNTAGGVAEFDGIPNPSIALQGSGTADAPYVAFHLDLTGKTDVSFTFNARDLDGSADNAVQQIAVQYRVGDSGAYTNLPAGYIADATTVNAATQVTPSSVDLPGDADDKPSVFVRVITSNAAGSDEWVGIDDVNITATTGASALSLTNPGAQTSTVGTPISTLTLAASGGTSPYTFGATNLPAGLTLDTATGAITGTPITASSPTVDITVTDDLGATNGKSFVWTVNDPAAKIAIATIQGTGDASPLDGQDVRTEGVVTASYPTGGLNGFYLQTPGADTANASDAIFVYGGTTGFATYPAIGDSVEVSGEADEFFGTTQIVATDAGVVEVADLGTVTPKTQIPGTNCALPGTGCLTGTALNDAREVAENELFQPTAPWTVTDSYDGSPNLNTNGSNDGTFRGELAVAADSSKPLVAPTEIIDAQNTADINTRKAYNAAKRLILDDGSSWTYSTTSHQNDAFPWFTADHNVRAGSAVTFPKPVIFTYGFNFWRILPQTQMVGAPTGTINFTQTRPAAPENVGGDVKLATFNVLNFFPTTGEEFDAGPGTCSFYTDRAGVNISNNQCNPNGPRGAANNANLVRQRDKIVAAINTVDADIVSLEELENSVQFGKDRDFAIDALVTALNADAGAGTWAAVPSPDASELPILSEQDVIRNGFIYKPANVSLVGVSDVLADQSTGTEAFADAREPVAQAFKQVGTADADAFAVIVNHFKSKGSGTPDPDGQGNANDRRKLQAAALVTFADEFKTARGISRVFLAGDFNAYSEEDPIQILRDAGYANLESTSKPDEETYNFDGQIGSLDHVLANEAAENDVNAVDIWDINGYESVYYEYARFNTNVTNLYAPNPYRSSDHSPEIIGINTAPAVPAEEEIQILGINDFHGRILNEDGTNGTSPSNVAGAAVLSGAVKQLRASNPNTVFAAAGDLIGASTFESFIQKDKPTIDALNEAGLDVSAVGNHELDAGYNDLVNRVMAPYNATTNPLGGATWKYISANLRKRSDNSHAVDDSWIKDFGDVQVGFVGAVTEDLPSLVSPDGIADIKVTDIVEEVNASADALEADGADVIVLLIHEGAANTTLAAATDPNSAFGQVVNGVDTNIDAIVSGHTHLAYNHAVPVPAWVTEGRAVTTRPVVSAGQYGTFLNQLNLTVDTATGDVLGLTQNVLNLKAQTTPFAANYPADPAVTPIVNAAVAQAEVLGAVELGKVAAPFNRAKLANGTTENRGGESTLGNLVAEVQRWATSTPEAGAGQIAFMNPGGLRQDMVGNVGGYPATLTYKQAAVVQPFANTLINMQLTGAQIKTALEQQWQRDGSGNIPSRPFLRLGTSKGFKYTYDPTRPEGDRILEMRLNGTPIAAGTTYSVTVNSFLASGGDNFRVFAQGTQKRDTGKVDLQAMVDYMDEFANTSEGDSPLTPDRTQHSVGVTFPAAAPTSYKQGDNVTFNLTSLAFTSPADIRDSQVEVRFGGTLIGTAPVDNTIGTAVFDEYGTATVTVKVPNGAPNGRVVLKVTGNNTGTTIDVPITVNDDRAPSTITVPAVSIEYGQAGALNISIAPTATGSVEIFEGNTSLGTATLASSAATFALAAKSLSVGAHTLRVVYPGDANVQASSTTVSVTVTKATSNVAATVAPAELLVGVDSGTISVTVTGETPTGLVVAKLDGEVIGGAELVNGAATIDIGPFATVGTKVIEVRYQGDAVNAAGTDDVSVTVVEDERATSTITVPAVSVAYGQAGALDITVAPSATGSVEIFEGTTSLGTAALTNSTASFALAAKSLAVGVHTLRVVYPGDTNVKASSTDVAVTVTKASSSTTATVTPAQLKAGVDSGTISVTVTGQSPTGLVGAIVDGQVIGGAELTNGAATINIGPFTTTGTKAIEVRYYGDTNNAVSSANVSVTVVANPVPEKATPTITATVDPATLKVKKDATTVAVSVTRSGGTATGTVLAVVDNTVVGAGDLVAGKANIVIGPFDTVGAKTITVKYLGDDDTSAGNGNASVTVQKATPKLTVKAPKKVKKGNKVVIKATTSADGFVPTGQVKVSTKGKSATATLSGGTASLNLGKLKPGKYTVTVTYLGSDIADTVTQTVKVTVKKGKKGKGKKKN